MPFLWSGYLPLLLFRHLGGRILLFIRAKVPLLYHQRVTIFDIFLARALLEIFTNLTAPMYPLRCSTQSGHWTYRDLPMFYLGYFYMIWWSVAVALIVGALCERTDWVQQVWMPDSYLYMIFSGFLSRGLAATIPPQGSVVPALYSGVRMIRGGVFGTTITTYGDPAYTTFALAT